MHSSFRVALVALALAGPGMAWAATSGSGGAASVSSGGSGSSSSSSGAVSSGGASAGGSSGHLGGTGGSSGHLGGVGGAASHSGGAGGRSFVSRGCCAIAAYGIRIGPHNGGVGAPAITQLTHGAAHAAPVRNAAHAMPVEDRTRPHPHPRVHPAVHYALCSYGTCKTSYTMPDLFCTDPRADEQFFTPIDCPRAIKTKDRSQ